MIIPRKPLIALYGVWHGPCYSIRRIIPVNPARQSVWRERKGKRSTYLYYVSGYSGHVSGYGWPIAGNGGNDCRYDLTIGGQFQFVSLLIYRNGARLFQAVSVM